VRHEESGCPFLIPVMADRLWVFPTTAYCHRPGACLRVPGRHTVARLCTTALHLTCGGYRASAAPVKEKARR